jgi:hypothetical protein
MTDAPTITTGRDLVRVATGPRTRGVSRLVLLDPRAMTVEPIEFLDDDWRHPVGMTTLVVGDGDLGKSLYSVMLAAKVTAAGYGAIFATAEDDATKTWLPRLLAAGVNLDLTRLVRVEKQEHGFDWDESIHLPDDLRQLQAELARFREESRCEVRLLVVDPLEAHLSDVNDDGNSSTRRRQALAPLEAFANREDVHVLAVHHINKDTSQKASHRVLGTIANRNAPRNVLLFGVNPDNDEERVVLHDKHNVSAGSPTQVYAVEPTTVHDDGGMAVLTARLVYRRDTDLDVNAIFGRSAHADDEASALDEAVDFLRDELATGPVRSSQLHKDAEAFGIARSTLKKAKQKLGAEAKRAGGVAASGYWEWYLPLIETSPEDGNETLA